MSEFSRYCKTCSSPEVIGYRNGAWWCEPHAPRALLEAKGRAGAARIKPIKPAKPPESSPTIQASFARLILAALKRKDDQAVISLRLIRQSWYGI